MLIQYRKIKLCYHWKQKRKKKIQNQINKNPLKLCGEVVKEEKFVKFLDLLRNF